MGFCELVEYFKMKRESVALGRGSLALRMGPPDALMTAVLCFSQALDPSTTTGARKIKPFTAL